MKPFSVCLTAKSVFLSLVTTVAVVGCSLSDGYLSGLRHNTLCLIEAKVLYKVKINVWRGERAVVEAVKYHFWQALLPVKETQALRKMENWCPKLLSIRCFHSQSLGKLSNWGSLLLTISRISWKCDSDSGLYSEVCWEKNKPRTKCLTAFWNTNSEENKKQGRRTF